MITVRISSFYRNGSAEAAVYCAVSLLMERLKAEQRVDVLQTVRSIQQQRPETFTKVVRLSFIQLFIQEERLSNYKIKEIAEKNFLNFDGVYSFYAQMTRERYLK